MLAESHLTHGSSVPDSLHLFIYAQKLLSRRSTDLSRRFCGMGRIAGRLRPAEHNAQLTQGWVLQGELCSGWGLFAGFHLQHSHPKPCFVPEPPRASCAHPAWVISLASLAPASQAKAANLCPFSSQLNRPSSCSKLTFWEGWSSPILPGCSANKAQLLSLGLDRLEKDFQGLAEFTGSGTAASST